MIVLYVVLCFTVRAYQATPLYLEIHHRDPKTGEILSTTEMEIESDDGDLPTQVSPLKEEVDPVALEYYYGCSMPLPPPIERSNLINDVEGGFEPDIDAIPISSTVIEKSDSSYDVREPNSPADGVVDSTIGGVNSIVLQLMSLGFRAFNRFS